MKMGIQHASIPEAANCDFSGDAFTSLQRWGMDFAKQYDLHMQLRAVAASDTGDALDLKPLATSRNSSGSEG
jgi:hypothetical protein